MMLQQIISLVKMRLQTIIITSIMMMMTGTMMMTGMMMTGMMTMMISQKDVLHAGDHTLYANLDVRYLMTKYKTVSYYE